MLRIITVILLALALALSSAACGQTAPQSTVQPLPASPSPAETASTTAEPAPSESAETGSNILVAYFSWSGNTAEIAAYIAEQTGADLYEIEPETPYPESYSETGELAQEERDNNARPVVANLPASLDEYDAIIIGYPIWWHTAPMIIGSFLNSYDLTGKSIYPFSQSSSMDTEQFENSMDFIHENAPGADVHDGLFSTDEAVIASYLAANNL